MVRPFSLYHHRRDHQDAAGIPLQFEKQKNSSKILPTDPWTKRRASGTVRIDANTPPAVAEVAADEECCVQFSVRDPSQPHFELVNNISSLIQQGSDVITKYSGFVSKLQQNKYQFHLLFHYRGTSTRDRRLAGMLVRSFTFDHDLLVATLPVTLGRLFFVFFILTVGLMDSLIKLS